MKQHTWNEQASQAWEGFVGSQTPKDFMYESHRQGYLTVEAATDAYEGNLPGMFPEYAGDLTGIGALLAEYIRFSIPEPDITDAIETLKREITLQVNARQHGEADRIAARGAEHMDHESLQAFVAWCAELGIK